MAVLPQNATRSTTQTILWRWPYRRDAGYDVDHDYQPPCPNNIVGASIKLFGRP
ncbi:hypothetical protein TorRG33x02_121420 [Trema orientale]|uniref:Uncharacterized protein n=1 Tax=Trema orientale TaxID=63057 RepID=A0A2P5F2Q2_TREOI|nr:hypothetical protein TorRG33x02_121420 [Trema orientale]